MIYHSRTLQAIRVRYRQEALKEERIRIEEHRSKEAEKRNLAQLNKSSYTSLPLPRSRLYTNGESKKELLARSRYLLFKFESELTDTQRERANILFKEFPEIHKAYKQICSFRAWYNISKDINKTPKKLNQWCQKTTETNIPELMNLVSMIKKHTPEILAYFEKRHTNAFAESLNAKIQRFIINNFGIRNRDFFHFRLMKFLS